MSVNRFCAYCETLLDPTEDPDKKILVWKCPDCFRKEEATDDVIYRKEIQKPQATDAILPRTRNARCPSCGHHESGFFKARAPGELLPTLFFVCCRCAHRWQERPEENHAAAA